MSSPLYIGIDLGGTTIKTGCVSHVGKILSDIKVPTEADKGPDTVVQQIMLTIESLYKQYGKNSFSAIGIGSPGIVHNGIVKAPPNISGWSEVNLQQKIREITGLKTIVENDANAAALAEAMFGAGREEKDFLFVIWGTGVGGGIILDKKIYQGPNGGAGEIGHVSIDYSGPQCNCGNKGCIEAYIGQRYLSQRTREQLKQTTTKSLILDFIENDVDKIEPHIISQAAEKGDVLARKIMEEAGALMGYALVSVLNILDIETVIIGGGISASPEFVYDSMRNAILSRILQPHRANIKIIRATLGNSAGIIGAASLVM